MKNKNLTLIIVFALLAIIYIIRSFASGTVVKETLYKERIEDSINTKGMVVKYESLYSPDVQGVMDSKFASGERVSKGSLIAVIYKGSVDPDVKNRLEQVNRKISIIEGNQVKNSAFSNDISKIEQEISSNIDGIIQSSYMRDMKNVASLKYNITALTEHKGTIEGHTQAKSATLDSLYQTKADLETKIGVAQNSIYAQSSGLFSSYIDGLEQLVTPYNMHELTPSKFDELYEFDENNVKTNSDSGGNYVCKIIDNYRYFIAFKADSEKVSDLKEGDSTHLRFYDISTSSVPVEIFWVSPVEEDGERIVIVECHDYQEGLLEKRFINMDFIKKAYNGYKLSLSALRTKDNQNGVYVIRENILRFVPVNIVYKEGDTILVDSQDESNPLRLYDEVVINASEYQEGQLIN